MLPRLLLMAALPALLLASPVSAASPTPAPTPCPSAPPVTANPGTVTGTIRCIDFQGGTAVVTIGGAQNALTTVLVTAGTLIQLGSPSGPAPRAPATGSAYRGMTDLRAGTPVQAYTTLANGKLTATILVLQK
ncbi:MAG: hypothetical protein ABR591_11655 [Candidatus Velthaea sp.]